MDGTAIVLAERALDGDIKCREHVGDIVTQTCKDDRVAQSFGATLLHQAPTVALARRAPAGADQQKPRVRPARAHQMRGGEECLVPLHATVAKSRRRVPSAARWIEVGDEADHWRAIGQTKLAADAARVGMRRVEPRGIVPYRMEISRGARRPSAR